MALSLDFDFIQIFAGDLSPISCVNNTEAWERYKTD